MKMKSTNLKKRRRKVIVSRRLNSISNGSLSLGTIANYKRKNIALLKNNKTLAAALEDAHCELSTKQKLLEDTAEHLKNIMEARGQILEMQSVLKTLIRNCDDTLLLLKGDNIRISDLTVPFQSCSAFKSKMKNLAEFVESVPEENSFSVEQEKVTNDNNKIKTLNPYISRGNISSNLNYVPMVVTDGCAEKMRTEFRTKENLPVRISTENASAFNSGNTINTVVPVSSVMFCENSKEPMNPNEEKQTSPTKIDSLNDRESTGTPKLSIPGIIPCINSEEPSSSSLENTSNALKPSLSSLQNVRSSKIPQFQALSFRVKKESNLSDIATGSKKISPKKKLHISAEPGLKGRRKTFVVKNSEAVATISESTSTLNQRELENENNINIIEDSGQINRRETFVIKNLDILEDTTKPLCNRRKTFVKKSNSNIKTRKSMNNRRDTFVLPDIKENYTNNETIASATENLVCDDIAKKKLCHPPSVGKVAEELQSVCDEITENSKTFEDNLVCSEISTSSKMISLQDYSQGKETVLEMRKITPKKKEKELKQGKNSSNDVEENSLKAENLNECDNVESSMFVKSNVCVTLQDCAQFLHGENEIEILEENAHRSRAHKRVSYRMFLESSDSDCESIPDLDLPSITEPFIKSFPVRRKISGSRKKKVFVFSAQKRKSVQNRKSLNILPKIVKHPDFLKKSEDVSQFDSVSIKDEDYISVNNSKYQSKKKLGKSVDCIAKMSDSGTSCSAPHEAPNSEQEMLQSASHGDRNTENSTSINDENPQNHCSLKTELTVSKSGENFNKNSVSYSDSPVITSDKCVNAVDFTNENVDCIGKDSEEGQDIINNIFNKTKPNVETNTTSKNSNVKKHTLKVCRMDDIPVKKNAKRNNSKKQSKQIITVEVPTSEQVMLQSTSPGVKNTENFKSVNDENPQNQGTLKNELTASKSGKNVHRHSVSYNDSPAIISDKCVNGVDFTSENVDCISKDSRQGQDINNIFNKTKLSVETNTASKNSKVKKHTSKVCHMDDIPVKNNAKKINSEKQSKQIITVDEGEENEIDLLAKNKYQGNRKKQKNKIKVTISERKSPINSLKDNAIVVRAEVHPPPPFLSKSETGVLNKENRAKPVCENFEVSVVLSDIFQSKNTDVLSLSQKDKLVPNSRNLALKTPLSDNSSNIFPSVGDSNKSDGRTASTFQEIKRSKRNRVVNYAEPPLNKKLRR